jgi:flavin-binding protein dodecin
MKIFAKPFPFIIVIISAAVAMPFNASNAGFLDDIVKNAKESIEKSTQETIDEAKQDVSSTVDAQVQETTQHVQQTTDESVKFVTQEINKGVTDVNQAVNTGVAMTVDAAVDNLSGNKNPIATIGIEGVFIGNDAAKASTALTSAGYQQVSNNPMIFQKGANTLSVSTKDNKVNSITLDGFASIDTAFVNNEKLRIEEALGKACPPVEQASNWLCTMEGEAKEYFLEFQVRRNKFSYVVEGAI